LAGRPSAGKFIHRRGSTMPADFALSSPELCREWGMFTKEILYGMNLLTLAGFVLMGIGLTLNRQQKVGMPIAFALMGAGTVLVFLGLYLATPAPP
jgi:hypothetical protein